MSKYIIYNLDGKIINQIDIPSTDKDLMLKDVIYIAGEAPEFSYIENKQIVLMKDKPEGFWLFDYQIKDWVLDSERTIFENRMQRDKLLQQSDWTQLPDVALTQAEKDRWAIYRQELRDMTEQDYLDGNFPIY